MDSPTKEELFKDWYEREYELGYPYERNFDRSLSYLQGLVDASDPDSHRYQGLVEVISTLRQCRNIIDVMDRYKIKAPETRA